LQILISTAIKKKAAPPFPGNPAFTASSGNPAIPLLIKRDPWLSVTRLLGVWHFLDSILMKIYVISKLIPYPAIGCPK
jgi:hypothetical protein